MTNNTRMKLNEDVGMVPCQKRERQNRGIKVTIIPSLHLFVHFPYLQRYRDGVLSTTTSALSLSFLVCYYAYILLHFNPRRACAARVTVVVVFVCLSFIHSVCYARTHFSSHRSRQKQGHIPSGGRRSENMWDFL